ncbi:hypothetical protein PCANC_09634 [Puccinia coronata f. sp. avenae]|uniref:Uncharacterized protein n=1 Tax=Puccinia coronata f. sp. avenae TaxID=200324 RepID=A0A2N5V1T1_9BASI|nr:hypothetical protein PCANC_09634 [Puccinia coronata f. sp. avenae]
MNFHIPTKPEEWVEVNQLVLSHYQSSISPSTHITIWLVTVLGPIPGILYLISAVKKCQINGWWLVRIDEGGYLYPHNRVMLSTWVIALTIVNLAHSISLLHDFETHFHPRTVLCHLLTFLVLSCFAWGKVWSLYCSMPPCKYRLAQANNKSGASRPSMKRPIPAYLFNPLIIAVHLISLFGGFRWLWIAIKEVYHLSSLFDQYQASYASLSNPNSPDIVVLESQIKALFSLKEMLQSGGIVRQNLKYLAGFLIILNLIQLVFKIWCSYRIMGALLFQAKILRQAAARQMALKAANSDYMCDAAKLGSQATIASADPTPENPIFTSRWRDLLPNFRRGNKVSAQLWNSGPFIRTQEQILADGVEDMADCYRKLRDNAIHTFWTIVMAVLMNVSCTTMDAFLNVGFFDNLSIFDTEVAIYLWVNLTWNCGVGLLLGVSSCIIVFTAAPTLPREPDA